MGGLQDASVISILVLKGALLLMLTQEEQNIRIGHAPFRYMEIPITLLLMTTVAEVQQHNLSSGRYGPHTHATQLLKQHFLQHVW